MATVVHHPLDARILERQVAAVRAGGHDVVYVGPWEATGSAPPEGIETIDVPRAVGRSRLGALRAARRLLREGLDADVLVVHDPELAAALLLSRRPPTVWDVHEDVGAQMDDKGWLPRGLAPLARRAVRGVERLLEARMHVILAEDGYRSRFRKDHPVVPNEPVVPESVAEAGDTRVVYVGRVSVLRGASELAALGGLLPEGVRLEVMGPVDGDVPPLSAAEPSVDWAGFVPNADALRRVEGALAGLSLLHDHPNYRHSLPTKVLEYMSRGVPVVTTPNPLAREVVEEHGCGIVVPYESPAKVAAAIRHLLDNPEERVEMGRRGHRAARDHHDWARSGPEFVRLLEGWARA